MNYTKKAQIAGQVFIYVLAVALFALIISYGYRAVATFTSQGEQVALIEFKTDLSSSVKSISYTQDKEKREFILPSKVNEICFIDLGMDANIDGLGMQSKSNLIFDSWESKVKQNVFLIPSANIKIDIGNITLINSIGDRVSYFCHKTPQHRISLMLEGLGARTQISYYNSTVP